jgi:hypothetical protein
MNQKPTERKIGDRMPDGTIFAGISPETKMAMFIADERSAFTRFMDNHPRISRFLNKHPKLYSSLIRTAHHIPVLKNHVPLVPPIAFSFYAAKEYAADLNAHGHNDWCLPTKGELNELFNNRAELGKFNVSGSNPAGWYWSSATPTPEYAWGQRFSDGFQNFEGQGKNRSSVVYIRHDRTPG